MSPPSSTELLCRAAETDPEAASLLSAHPRNVDGVTLLLTPCARMTAKFYCALQQSSSPACPRGQKHVIGGITAIIGMVVVGTVIARTAMSVRFEKQLPSTEPRNEPRNQGDFSAAIGQMIHTCEYRCKSYEICRLMASLKWSSRLSSNAMHWSKSEVRRLTSLNPLQPHVLKTFRVAFTNV